MPIVDSPLLIVNADDFGWNRSTTDATLEAFEAGRITSATALMYMADSERAVELARKVGLPLGLHLNLTDPFDATDVPAQVRERQMLAVRHFGAPATVWRSRRWLYDPRATPITRAAIDDQLDRFRELTGREPTHFDGHNHVQVCPEVALALPGGVRVRTALGIGGGGPRGRLLRIRQRLTLRDRITTRHFLNITGLHPEFVEGGPRSLLGFAATTSVEVMAHPGFGHELALLMAPAWAEWTAGLPPGSFDDLG